MKSFRAILSLFMVAVLLAGFVLVPGAVMAEGILQPGDINGDGKVNLGDVSRIYSHIRSVRLITDEEALKRADLSGDGKLNIGDVARAYTVVCSGELPKTNVTLKVWTPSWDQDGGSSWLSRMQKSFEESHPRYNITWINEVCSEGDAGYIVSNSLRILSSSFDTSTSCPIGIYSLASAVVMVTMPSIWSGSFSSMVTESA